MVDNTSNTTKTVQLLSKELTTKMQSESETKLSILEDVSDEEYLEIHVDDAIYVTYVINASTT